MRVTNVTPCVQVRYSSVLLDAGVQVADAEPASVTVSPSSSRISRSTPWVDGCCGPMLTTIRSSALSPRPAVIESQSRPVTV